MRFMSKSLVEIIVAEAIQERQVLQVRYEHTQGGTIVEHRLAPFDIGTTNPKTRERFADKLYAYSYTHVDKATGQPDPRVCVFNIGNFLSITPTGETFDENELATANKRATGYDYRTCKFALSPNRNWFGR